MTIAADVGIMIGDRFDSTAITASIVAAGSIVSGKTDSTWVEDSSEILDAAVTILARNILLSGKNIQTLQHGSQITINALLTPEINKMIGAYKQANFAWYADISPETKNINTKLAWRS